MVHLNDKPIPSLLPPPAQLAANVFTGTLQGNDFDLKNSTSPHTNPSVCIQGTSPGAFIFPILLGGDQ